MSGTLYLIPNTLGTATRGGLPAVLPEEVRTVTAGLTYFVGEQAKSTRAFLKLVGVNTPIQDIEIRVPDPVV